MLRLTLRTLLAWLDGVLPTEETAAFTEKLASGSSARVLVDRIRAVVAHPGLDAPKPIGRGLGADANSVAEYLTNSLPADAVAAFERVCIESDSHLAEVASCHRMLVEARNDPHIFEPPEADELDGLLARVGGAAGGSGTAAGPSAGPTVPQERPRSAFTDPGSSEPSAARPTLVPQGSKTSRTAWASVVVAALLVAVLAGALAWRLAPNFMGGAAVRKPDAVAEREPARRPQAPLPPKEQLPAQEQVPPQARVRDNAPPPPVEEAAVEPEPAPAATEPAATETVARHTPSRDNDSAAPASTTAIAEPSAPSQPVAEPKPPAGRVPGGDALAIAAKPAAPRATVVEPAAPSAPPPPKPPAPVESPPDERSAFAIVGDAPLLLKRVGDAGGPADWELISAGTPVAARSDLLVPEGFFPTVAIEGVTIRLIGPARAVLRPRGEAGQEFELVFGRAVASGIGGRRSLSFAAGDLEGSLEGGDPIGLEVRLDREPGSDPETVPATAFGSIAFPAGGRLSLDSEPVRSEPQGGAAGEEPNDEILIRPDGSVATGVVVMGRGVASRGLPGWLALTSPPHLLDRLAAEAVAAGLLAAPTPAALERLLEDNRLENRSIAAATLALMGRYEPLAELLAAEEPGRRLPARAWETLERATIPLALARGPASAGRLLAAVESVAPPDAAKLVRQLVVGFSDEAVSGGGDAVLVSGLEHPSLLVRRLALARLIDTISPPAADRLRYRPDGPADARGEAVKWWRAQLEKGRIRRGGEGALSKAQGE